MTLRNPSTIYAVQTPWWASDHLQIEVAHVNRELMESETQAEPARRRRGGLLIEPVGRTLVFGVPVRSTGGGGPTDTDSAVNLGAMIRVDPPNL